ncbi:MAG TPA: preprotein translocase subunit SecG [Armatimonadota bacterium]|jgi:protein translocase SecG subunit
MIIFFTVIAALAGISVIACMCLQTGNPDAGFSAAMGGGGDSSSHKGGADELLSRILKISAVVWILSCLFIAIMEAHPSTFGGGLGG